MGTLEHLSLSTLELRLEPCIGLIWVELFLPRGDKLKPIATPGHCLKRKAGKAYCR